MATKPAKDQPKDRKAGKSSAPGSPKSPRNTKASQQTVPRLTLDKQNIFNVIEQEQNRLNDIGHDVWQYSEPGGIETKSNKRITAFLKHKGFTLSNLVHDFDGAFRAEFGQHEFAGRSHPNIGLLCEFTADTQNGHSHGNNLVTASCLAAAIGLQRAIRFSKKPLGMVTVMGCPSNAAKTRKKEMLEAGCFKGIDVLISASPANFTSLQPRFLASKRVQVTFIGRGPQDGVTKSWEMANPVNAVVMTHQSVAAFRGTLEPDWTILGVIPIAGKDPCSIPHSATCVFDMKATTLRGIDVLRDKLHQCVEGASLASGCKFTESVTALPFVSNVNCPGFVKIYRKNASLNGFTFHSEDKTILRDPDEISFLSRAMPTFKMFYYAGTPATLGTDEFNRYSGSDKAEYMNIVQGKSIAMMAVDLMLEKNVIAGIIDDHTNDMNAEKEEMVTAEMLKNNPETCG